MDRCRTWPRLLPALALPLAVLAAGCGGGECVDPPPEDAAMPRIIGGTPGREAPEFGMLSNGCSAELIAPSTVLTAAHCVGYLTSDLPGQIARSFVVDTGTACHPAQRSYRVIAVHAYSPDAAATCLTPWCDDVALARLETPVPPEVATPRALATVAPVTGDAVTVVGWGCPSNGTFDAIRTKRWRSFTFAPDAPDALCAGDSGGALLVGGRDGPIAGVHSQSPCSPWSMIFGDVVGLRAQLDAQREAWDARFGGP